MEAPPRRLGPWGRVEGGGWRSAVAAGRMEDGGWRSAVAVGSTVQSGHTSTTGGSLTGTSGGGSWGLRGGAAASISDGEGRVSIPQGAGGALCCIAQRDLARWDFRGGKVPGWGCAGVGTCRGGDVPGWGRAGVGTCRGGDVPPSTPEQPVALTVFGPQAHYLPCYNDAMKLLWRSQAPARAPAIGSKRSDLPCAWAGIGRTGTGSGEAGKPSPEW